MPQLRPQQWKQAFEERIFIHLGGSRFRTFVLDNAIYVPESYDTTPIDFTAEPDPEQNRIMLNNLDSSAVNATCDIMKAAQIYRENVELQPLILYFLKKKCEEAEAAKAKRRAA
jgi:hypothetical protein